MNKKRSFLLFLALLIVAGVTIFFTLNHINKARRTNSEITLFYSLQCVHCKVVEDFLQKHNMHSKIHFIEKEITQNAANFKELVRISKKCYSTRKESIGIPLLWTGSKCLVGSEEIMDFFNKESHLEI